MGVWPRTAKYGGRLPLDQLIFVSLLGTIFQGAWLFLSCIYVPERIFKAFQHLASDLAQWVINSNEIPHMGGLGPAIKIFSLCAPIWSPYFLAACLQYFNADMEEFLTSVREWGLWLPDSFGRALVIFDEAD